MRKLSAAGKVQSSPCDARYSRQIRWRFDLAKTVLPKKLAATLTLVVAVLHEQVAGGFQVGRGSGDDDANGIQPSAPDASAYKGSKRRSPSSR